jgi:hypothetical protein
VGGAEVREMNAKNDRRYERVETSVRVKLPGDATWTESTTANVSGGGLFFDSAKQLNPEDLVTLQFMLQSKSGTLTNVHFFASARVVRVIPKADIYQIAAEFIIDGDNRKEILKLIERIKSQNLLLERPTSSDTLFGRST